MDCRDLKRISERLNVTLYRMEDNIKDCQRRYERRKRKRQGVKYSITIILILIICVVPVSVWEKTNIFVYANGIDKNIELRKNEKVILKKK